MVVRPSRQQNMSGFLKRELKPTKMTLQLADRSIIYPFEILEDIPIKVGKIYIPAD
jgi:hypothetical protein